MGGGHFLMIGMWILILTNLSMMHYKLDACWSFFVRIHYFFFLPKFYISHSTLPLKKKQLEWSLYPLSFCQTVWFNHHLCCVSHRCRDPSDCSDFMCHKLQAFLFFYEPNFPHAPFVLVINGIFDTLLNYWDV